MFQKHQMDLEKERIDKEKNQAQIKKNLINLLSNKTQNTSTRNLYSPEHPDSSKNQAALSTYGGIDKDLLI